MNAITKPLPYSAHIVPRVGVASTEYLISGELVAVLNTIEALYMQYHPYGYDTTVHGIRFEGGKYIARMSRLNSCE